VDSDCAGIRKIWCAPWCAGNEEPDHHQQQRRSRWIGKRSSAGRGQIKKHIGTLRGENKLLEQLVLQGKLELDLVPQGTFSERMRAAGAGIPAFFTPTGVGTLVAKNKETREFDGRPYLMERALSADFAFVKAVEGDKWGNLVYRKDGAKF